MFEQLRKCGIASKDNINSVIPDPNRRQEKGYVIIECYQEIPCDPCVAACPKKAIKPMSNINETPIADLNICDGCGLCIALCPGLAIFAVDETREDYAILKIPHEFNPPAKGDIVEALGRDGKIMAKVEVDRVIRTKSKTSVVWLRIKDRELLQDIRAIKPSLPFKEEL
ncbi:MAG: 4Fe-4S ferredoxin [Candidatus Zixiibacteriota bacterium]